MHELTGVRLPLQPYSGGHAVFMYSTAADGNVTLQLKEPDDLDRSSLAAMLARLQDDATFSISYQDTDILSDGGIDVLLGSGTGTLQNTGEQYFWYHLEPELFGQISMLLQFDFIFLEYKTIYPIHLQGDLFILGNAFYSETVTGNRTL